MTYSTGQSSAISLRFYKLLTILSKEVLINVVHFP